MPDPARAARGDRLRTMEELRTALDDDELVVHLQPQVDLRDGRVVGAEALVRWQHPTRGLLSPADLLPAAEQAGLLRPLDRPRARAGPRRRPPAGGRDRAVPVSVNLSAANVTDLDLPGKVAAGAAPARPARRGRSRLELVEDTLMADPERGRTVLGRAARGSASARRSTTTAPATARWPTCGTCPPTSSSSTAA